MKKYLMIALIATLSSCSKNEFVNSNYAVVSVAQLVNLSGEQVRIAKPMPSDRILVWEFYDSEIEMITYGEHNRVYDKMKSNYSLNGSFIKLEDEKYEIRHNKDTVELYKGVDLIYQLVKLK